MVFKHWSRLLSEEDNLRDNRKRTFLQLYILVITIIIFVLFEASEMDSRNVPSSSSQRPLFSETLYIPRNKIEKLQGGIPYRSQEESSAHAAALLREQPSSCGLQVKLEIAKFMSIKVNRVERVFPDDATITDIQNLCVAAGLKEGTFELSVGDKLLPLCMIMR